MLAIEYAAEGNEECGLKGIRVERQVGKSVDLVVDRALGDNEIVDREVGMVALDGYLYIAANEMKDTPIFILSEYGACVTGGHVVTVTKEAGLELSLEPARALGATSHTVTLAGRITLSGAGQRSGTGHTLALMVQTVDP